MQRFYCRLVNGRSWSADFVAYDVKSFEAGCRWAWLRHIERYGLGHKKQLSIAVYGFSDWYFVAVERVRGIRQPHKTKKVSRATRDNDYSAIWADVHLQHTIAVNLDSFFVEIGELIKTQPLIHLVRECTPGIQLIDGWPALKPGHIAHVYSDVRRVVTTQFSCDRSPKKNPLMTRQQAFEKREKKRKNMVKAINSRVKVAVGAYQVGDCVEGQPITNFGRSWQKNEQWLCYAYFD